MTLGPLLPILIWVALGPLLGGLLGLVSFRALPKHGSRKWYYLATWLMAQAMIAVIFFVQLNGPYFLTAGSAYFSSVMAMSYPIIGRALAEVAKPPDL